MTAIGNVLAFWKREQLGIELVNGIDEVALALVADAWSRTYRSRATFAGTDGALQTRNGMRILPERVSTNWPADRLLPAIGKAESVKALEHALRAIAARYRARTADFVAMQLEYPWRYAGP